MNRTILAIFSKILFLGLLLTHPGTLTLAQSSGGLTMSVIAGFDGHYKEATWFPVRITLENKGADLEGQIQGRLADAGTDADIYSFPISLPSVSRKEVTLYIFPQTYSRWLEITFVSAKKIIQKQQVQIDQISQNDLLYGVVADSGTTFNVLSQVSSSTGTTHIALLDIRNIPDRLPALVGLNALVFSNVDTGLLTAQQRQALWSWVGNGGRLVVTGGADWRKTIAGFDTHLLPMVPAGTTIVTDLHRLEPFANTVYPLEATSEGILVADGAVAEQAQIVVTGSTTNGQENVPLVIRQAVGAGEVIFLTFDPAQMPFKVWDGRQDFYTKLFSTNTDRPSWSLGFRNWSQAKEAAQTLLRLGLPSPVLICGFLILYTLILGPANYLLLKALKRRELGWVSTPLLVVSFAVLVILVGVFSRGSRPVLNRAAIIQSWEGLPEARVDGVVGIYSPVRNTYQADAGFPYLLHPMPDNSGLARRTYTIQQTGEMVNIPQVQIDISGITPMAFEGTAPALQISQSLVLNLDAQGAVLQGKVINQSQMTLEDAVLLAPGISTSLGSLRPGQSAALNIPLQRSQRAGESMVNPVIHPLPGIGQPVPVVQISGPADSSLAEIIGTNNYFDDRKNYRRYALVSAAMNYSYASGSTRGVGFYLVGWNSTLPDDIRLAKTSYETEDTAVYIISLKPDLQVSNEATLTPGLLAWQTIEGNDFNISPYNVWLYSGMTYAMEFKPIIDLAFTTIKSLTLHLESPGITGAVNGLDVSLWDFQSGNWESMNNLTWGDNPISDPASLVSEDGRLRLRLQAAPATNLQITRSDFTLVVGR